MVREERVKPDLNDLTREERVKPDLNDPSREERVLFKYHTKHEIAIAFDCLY